MALFVTQSSLASNDGLSSTQATSDLVVPTNIQDSCDFRSTRTSLVEITPENLYITQASIRIGLPPVLVFALMAKIPQHHGSGTMLLFGKNPDALEEKLTQADAIELWRKRGLPT